MSIWTKFGILYSVPLACKLVFVPMTCCLITVTLQTWRFLHDFFLVRKLSTSVSSSSEVGCSIDCFLHSEHSRHALPHPDFYMGTGDPNVGLHSCTVRTSLTEPSPQIQNFHFKIFFGYEDLIPS